MSSEAAVQNMGYVGPGGESYNSAPSTSVVYTNDGYQDSTSSQVFTSPVYNTQNVTQVYQIPPQSQSTLTSDNFTQSSENFTAPADTFSSANTASYVTTIASLPPSQQQQQQVMETVGLGNMEQISVQPHQNPDSNILHMQAQITQSAYELQNVQMQPSSMQTYDSTGMMQSSATFQVGTYQEGANMYQDGTNTYQEGTSTYQTGTNTYQIQEGASYQDGTGYQEHSQAAAHSHLPTSFTNNGVEATSVASLSLDASRQIYSTTQIQEEPQQQSQQMNFSGTGNTSSEVAVYNQQIPASGSHLQHQQENAYSSVTPGMFQQTSVPGSGGMNLQPQSQAAAEANVLQPQVLPTFSQVESVVDISPTSAGMEVVATTATTVAASSDQQSSSTRNGKTTKKSQKPKVSVGIQCEVGPETFRALKDEEALAKLASSTTSSSHESSGLDANPTSLLQKSVSASLLLNSSGSSPAQDAINVSSPGMNTSGSESTPTSLSDKVIRKFPCEVSTCSKAYVHRKDLIRHMSLRHGTSPLKLEPVVIETPEKPYTCQVGACKKSYFHQKDLRRHQRQCHSVTDDSHLAGAVEMTDADGKVMVRFPCDFPGCQRSYVHKKDLVRHKRVYHKDESKKPSIPVPVKFTEAELKRIRHEEKAFQEKETPNAKKPRLDSTGSMMSSGEDQSQYTDIASIQITENVELTQLSTSPLPMLEHTDADQNQVSFETLSSTVQEITEGGEEDHLTNSQLALGLSQQQQLDQASQLSVQQQIASQQSGGVHLPTILRRQRQGSNGQFASPTSQDQQQLSNGITLRNLASLMLGGLQGSSGSGGASFDITQQAVAAFSSPEMASQPTDSQQAAAAAAAITQFDPAAIISALSNVVNNPGQIQDMVQSASPSLEQQQVVSMENVANALQFLTSTSSST